MALSARRLRCLAGLFSARVPELRLDSVLDPRDPRGKRWPIAPLLISMLFGLVAGCNSLAQTEKFSDSLSKPIRCKFKLRRRTPDTTFSSFAIFRSQCMKKSLSWCGV